MSACNGSHVQWVDDRPVAAAEATGPRLEAFFNILLAVAHGRFGRSVRWGRALFGR